LTFGQSANNKSCSKYHLLSSEIFSYFSVTPIYFSDFMSTFEFLRKGIQKTENSFLWLGPPIGQGQPLPRGPRALLQVHPQSPPSLFGPLVRGALPNRASSTRYTRVPPAGTSLPPLPTAPPRALQLAARPAPSGWLLAPAPICKRPFGVAWPLTRRFHAWRLPPARVTIGHRCCALPPPLRQLQKDNDLA
jgi:hypothetical protein